MSDHREPTLREVLAAVQGLGASLQELDTRISGRVDGLQESLDKAKFELMDRIDRVQNTVDEQRNDMTVLLGLISSNQAIAERGLSEGPLAFDQNRSMAQTLTVLERQVRKLQNEMRELRRN